RTAKDHVTLGTHAWRAVDDRDPLVREPCERAREIVHDITDVMQRRPAALADETPYAAVGIERLHELEQLPIVAEEGDPDALVRAVAHRARAQTEHIALARPALRHARHRD